MPRILLLLLLLAPAAWAGDDGPVPLFGTGADGALSLVTGSEALRLERSQGRWWVTGADEIRRLADVGRATDLKARVAALTTARPLGRYGVPLDGAFTRPAMITLGGRSAAIGGNSRIPGLVYVRLDDDSVHLMQPPSLSVSAADLVDRRLFPDGLGGVTDLNLTGPDIALHATDRFGPWRLTAPTPSAADVAVIDRWLEALAALAGDPAPAPPGDQAVDVVLTGKKGATRNLSIHPGGIVALDGTVFRVDGGTDALMPTHFDWLHKEVLALTPEGITSIQVQQGEETVAMYLSPEGKWLRKDTGAEYRSWSRDLFGLLASLPATGLKDGDASALGPARVEARLFAGTEVRSSIEMWPAGEDGWWLRGGADLNVYRVPGTLPGHLTRLF